MSSLPQEIGAQLLRETGRGQLDEVNLLLEKATAEDVNFVANDKKGSALVIAAELGLTNIVRALLAIRGIDVNLKTRNGWTALMRASGSCRTEIVKLLLADPRVDANLQNKNGWTALMMASGSWCVTELVKMLLADPRVDANHQNKDGETALMMASGIGHTEIVKMLLAHPRADVNLQNKNGWTALMWASGRGRTEIVKLLLADPRVDINLLCKNGETALMKADNSKNSEVVKLFQSHFNVQGSFLPTIATTNAGFGSDPFSSFDRFTATASSPAASLPHSSGGLHFDAFGEAPLDGGFGAFKQKAELRQKELTAEDHAALESFLQSYTPAVNQALQRVGQLDEVMLNVSAHDRALQVLVNKQKECPSLFWFYPKKKELRNWLSNPLKCLTQDSLMMVVVCPVTLCVVMCGPDGVGWEIGSPKEWVKKWGPAILVSIYVMQAAVLAGRIVGIPLPFLPSVGDMAGALGLTSGVLASGLNEVTSQVNQDNIMAAFGAFAGVTEAALEAHKSAVGSLVAKMQEQQRQHEKQRRQRSGGGAKGAPISTDSVTEITLGADMPFRFIDESYTSIRAFLTSGENEVRGKLEDQLRGHMQREVAEDGEIEWVSVEGLEVWKQKHALPKPPPAVQIPVFAQQSQFAPPVVFSLSAPLPSASTSGTSGNTWLAPRLRLHLVPEDLICFCEQKLVIEDNLTTEALFSALPASAFNLDYLRDLGIVSLGLRQKIILVHKAVLSEQCPPQDPWLTDPCATTQSLATPWPETEWPTAGAFPPSPLTPLTPLSTASFATAESTAVLEEKLAAMAKEVSELKAASGKSGGSPVPVPSGGGSGRSDGGLIQTQLNKNAIDPQTRQPYAIDVAYEIQQLQRAQLATQQQVGAIGAAVIDHDLMIENQQSAFANFEFDFQVTKQNRANDARTLQQVQASMAAAQRDIGAIGAVVQDLERTWEDWPGATAAAAPSPVELQKQAENKSSLFVKWPFK